MKFLFCIIGIALIFGGFKLKQHNDAFFSIAEPVQGTVIDVQSYETTKRHDGKTRRVTEYKSKVEYTIPEGKSYTVTFDHKETKGDSVELFYDPENPNKVKEKSATFIHWIIMAMGLVFAGTPFYRNQQ